MCGNPVKKSLSQTKETIADPPAEYIKMDYNLKTPQERIEKVKEILKNTSKNNLTNQYLSKLADYIVDPVTKKEKKEKKILTNNRLLTINKRETSFEGLTNRLENGEDGIYNMITNDKNIIFQHKISITEEDIKNIPPLKELRQAIEKIKKEFENARGSKAYGLKKTLIEMYKDQYIIKNSYRPLIYSVNLIKSAAKINLSETITIDKETNLPKSNSLINLFNETHISTLLCNYSKLKEDNWDNVQSDIKWLLEDLDAIVEEALKEKYPMYYDLLIYKIDGKQNIEIQELLYKNYNIKHSVEYISSLWRNKIPKIIAETSINNYLNWYYTEKEKGKWKKCSRCGQIKLAHNNFFSKNSTSKDGWYSICKECRNKKPNQRKGG